MNGIKFRRAKLFSTGMLLLGITVFVIAYSMSFATGIRSAGGFTITSRQTFTPAGGRSELHATKERYQKSDGSFRVVTTYYSSDGMVEREQETLGLLGRGVFRVEKKRGRLVYLSDMPSGRVTESTLRNSPTFLREDSVLGYKTIVQRFPDKDGVTYTEIHFAPMLRGLPIKTVVASSDGVHVIEAIRIEIGEPHEDILAGTLGLPTDYSLYEGKIQEVENDGNSELGKQMRQRLEQHRSKQP